MSRHDDDYQPIQSDLFETEDTRVLLDKLLDDSRLYRQGKDYKALLDFVVRLRNFAPFNAMLLQIQKPGISYAATARDWHQRFGRSPKEGVRPLLIMWPFGPVALVYDVMDTEGKPLPDDVETFPASGKIDLGMLESYRDRLKRKHIDWYRVDEGDRSAGLIRVVKRPTSDEEATQYRMNINKNHDPAVQFVTLTHELGHLFLGHLGPDPKLAIASRPRGTYEQRELEAESVAFVVSERHGVKSKSQKYLSKFVDSETSTEGLAIYQIMRAAGQVEAILGLAVHQAKKAGRRPTAPNDGGNLFTH